MAEITCTSLYDFTSFRRLRSKVVEPGCPKSPLVNLLYVKVQAFNRTVCIADQSVEYAIKGRSIQYELLECAIKGKSMQYELRV